MQYAIVAADEALAQSGIDMEQEDPTRAAVIFGAGIGGIDELQNGFYTLHDKGPKRVNPLFIPTMIGNIAAGHLAIRYGMRGECIDVTTACATGAHNIGAAVRSIRHGYADMALGRLGRVGQPHLHRRIRQPGCACQGRRPRSGIAALR